MLLHGAIFIRAFGPNHVPRLRFRLLRLSGACLIGSLVSVLQAAPITWVGGNNNWVDNGVTANWNPADEPDADDTAIFNTANVVTLGSNNSILGLTMSGGIDLDTNSFDLDVNGPIQLNGANTNLIVGSADALLTADSITINNGANFGLNGGTVQLNEEAGNALLDINAGGELVGYGTLSLTDAVAANTTLIINDGAISARRSSLLILTPPPAGTLVIGATDADTRIDLDGGGEAGIVNVMRNQTLDLNVPLADPFGGTINLSHNATLDVANAWGLNTGTINVDNGLVDNPLPNPDIPAATSVIDGATLTQSGGTINVVDSDGTLRFDAPFSMTGGTFNNQGHTIFNADATINVGATFAMGPFGSDLTVGPNATVTIAQNSFNLDGNAAGTVITVNPGGVLSLNLGDYDNDAVANAFDGTIVLDSGDFTITTSDAEFVMDGVLNMSNSNSLNPSWNGEPLDIGSDAGTLDADLNVGGTGSSDFAASVDFNSDADVHVAAGSRLRFLSNATVDFNTVNGGNNAEFTGGGTIEFNGQVNVNEAVTLNMAGGTVDLDGNDAIGNVINIDAPLVLNAAALGSFGRSNSSGTNTLDINNSVGTGVLTVNLDAPTAGWTLNATGVMNLVNDNTEATLLAGSDVHLNGTVNVTGDVRTTARLDVAGTVNINTPGQPLRLAGGAADNPNMIAGGTISGVGLLGADDGKALHGFGTINTGIDFDGSAALRADNGTLTINGAILDAGQVGTADSDGTLHVTNAWNNSVTTGVQLRGGMLSGGTITNDVTAGISGHGLITARVINNTQLFASLGEALILETAGNDNDWDGATNAGEIKAISANIELRDTGAAFGFGGTVTATNGHTAFANGFALDFNPGSTLNLASGGKYQATSSTDLGGTVSVGAGGASIQVQNNFFLTFEPTSATTLGSNLELLNNNINIKAGATFSGTGALVVPDGSHLVMDANSNANVLLDMQGAFRPANFEGVGRVDVRDYQQRSATGPDDHGAELFVEIAGTSLNQFDRVVVNGTAQLGGYLNIDIDGGFVPVLGNTFNIVTASGGVVGEFDLRDISGMPAGLTFAIDYLPNAVQLAVVNKPFFSADFDDDGDVDFTDLDIWKGAFDVNQLGDANGDNRTDIDDWTLWRDQLGSGPALPGQMVPEPASLALVLTALMALALCRRGAGKGRTSVTVTCALMCAGFLAAVPATSATAAPTMSVTDNGLLGGNRQWLVQVAADPALLVNGEGALAFELGFEVTVGELLNASVNTSAWPYDLPANNSPPGYGVSPGLTVNTMTDRVFAVLGSDPLNNGNMVPVLAIVTEGAGETTLTWGGYTVPVPGNPIGGRIAQNGTVFNGYQGSLTLGGTMGEVWDNSSANGLWSDAVNWADDTEPTPGSAVTFPAGFPNGGAVVTLSAGEIAASLTFNDSYTLSGGSLTLPAGAAVSVASTKTATITSGLDVGTWTKSGDGTLVVPHVRADALTVGAGAVVTSTGEGASVLGALSIAGDATPTAKLDLANNAAILNYTGVSPAATVRAQVLAGRGGSGLGASWNGQGIASSAVAAANAIDSESRSIGYAENSALPLGPYLTFHGETVDDTSILMAFTRTGDANLDGVVNDDDVTILSAFYAPGVANPNWALGDFDYNGFVDDDDVTLLGAFYDPSAPPIMGTPAGVAGPVAAVPEPATAVLLGVMLVASAMVLIRRRNS